MDTHEGDQGEKHPSDTASSSAYDKTVDAHRVEAKRSTNCREPGCNKRCSYGPTDGSRDSAVFCANHGKKHEYENVEEVPLSSDI